MATPNNQFRLRLYPSTSYNFIVDWGDGRSDVFSGSTPTYQGATGSSSTWFTQISTISASWPGITHTYDLAGKYIIKISEIVSGGFAGIQYIGIDDNPHDNLYAWHPTNEYNHDAKKVTAVSQWGAIKWNPTKAMTNSFEGCVNLKDVVTDGGTSTLSALISLNRAWFFCSTLSSFGAIDTSNVIDFDNAWSSCPNLRISFPLINTSKGTSFWGTWYGCGLTAFPALDMNKAPQLLQTWEGCGNMLTFATTAISACTFLNSTWKNCGKLKEFPLIDTRNVTSCDRVWENCNALTAFPLIDMSKNTGRLYACWNDCDNLITFPMLDTKSVYDFGYAWNNCYSLKEFPALSAHNVTMFNNTWSNCISLTAFPLIDTSKGIDFSNAWSNCRSLTAFPLIDTSKGINFSNAWSNCISLKAFPLIDTSKGINFSNAWSAGGQYGGGFMALKSFPLINTLSGTNFYGSWNNCTSLTAFPLINTSNGKTFDYAWRGCSSLTYFPLLTTSKGETFNYTWADCVSLTSLPLLDFSKGTSFYGTWSVCPKLSTNGSFPINLDTSNSTSYGSAFATRPDRDDSIANLNSRTALTDVPEFLLNPLNTAKVKDFSNTWRGCTKLLSFPSTINMLNATNVAGAWGNCYSLTEFPNIMLSSVQIFGSRSTSVGFDATSYSIDHGNTVTGGSFALNFGGDSWLGGSGAWCGCYNMTSFPTLCTQNGTSFDLAWYGMKNLKEFPLIDTSNGTRFEKTWSYCFSLTSFPLLDFSKATNIMGAFYALTALKTFPKINTSKCKYFGGAWGYCISLTNFPSIDTLSATSFYSDGLIGGAWQNCVSLTSFPMIDTSNVTNFKNAWKNCYSLSASPFPQLNMSKMKQNSWSPNYFAALYDNDGARQSGEGGEGCFEGVKLQTQSYSALLTSLCATNFNSNVQFHGGLSNFNQAGKNARDYLITTKGWTIGGTGVLEP